MAKKENNTSRFGNKRAGNPEEIIKAGAIPGVEATIKDLLQNLSEGISKTMASFYVGDDQVKNPTDLGNKSKQKAGGTSILGNNNSIYSLLDEIKDAIGSKDDGKTIKSAVNSIDSSLDKFINTSFVEFGKLMSTNTESIQALNSNLVNSLNAIASNYTQFEQILNKKLEQPDVSSNVSTGIIDPEIITHIDTLKNSIDGLTTISDKHIQGINQLLKVLDIKDLFKNSEQKLNDINNKIDTLCTALSSFNLSKFFNQFNNIKPINNDETNKSAVIDQNIINNIIKSLNDINKTISESLIEKININNQTLLDKLVQPAYDSYIQTITTFIDKLKMYNDSLVGLNFLSNISANLSTLNDNLENLKTLKFDELIPNTVTTNVDPEFKTIVNDLKTSIGDLIKANKSLLKNKLPDQKMQVELIISGLNDDALDSLLKLVKLSDDKKTVKALTNFMNIIQTFFDFDKENVKSLKENIDLFNEMIQKISVLGQSADQAEAAAQKIKNVNHTIVETAVDVNNHQKEIKESLVTIEGLNSFMITSTIVMSIGALFMMMGGGKFVENALLFGVTLAVFESLIIAPILLFKKYSSDAIKGLKDLNSFVVTCTMVMLIGALFMGLSNGALVKNALKFGVVLMIFEALVVLPFMIFKNEANKLFPTLRDFNSFLITCTTILLVGALFMSMSNGKMVENALKFGLVLMAFEALVIAPFILYSQYSDGVDRSITEFTSLIIVCTIVLSIGALFIEMGGGKFVVNALAFGLLLMTFEALVVAPFLLFSMINGQIFSGLKAFNSVIVSCTIILLVGALFMELKGGKYVKAALEFTGLLMLFEAGVIAPFLLFNLVKGTALASLKTFALFMFTTTTCLLVGSLFMSMKNGMMAKYALDYTKLLALFIVGVIAATKPINSLLKSSTAAQMEQFSLFLAVCTGCLVMGATFIKKFGALAAIEYATVLLGFIKYMGKVSETIIELFNKKTLDSLKPFSIFLATMHGILTTGILFTKKYGVLAGAEYAAVFDGFIAGMGLASKRITDGFDKRALDSLKPFSLFVAVMHGILLTGTAYMKTANAWGSAILYAGLITAFVDMMLIPIAAIQAIKTLSVMGISKGGIAGSLTSATKGSGLMGFMLFVGAMHFIILSGATFMSQYGPLVVGGYAALLAGFTWSIIAIMKTLDEHQKDVQEGAKTLALISGSLLIFAGVVKAIDEMFPFEDPTEALVLVKVAVMTALMFALGKFYELLTGKSKISLKEKEVREASIIIGEISLSLGVFSGVVWLIDQMKIGFDTVAKVGLMELIMVGTLKLMSLAAKGIDKTDMLLANGILILMSLTLAIYGSSLFYLNSLFNEISFGEFFANMALFVASVGAYGAFFWAIGSLVANPLIGIPVAAGGATLIAMGEILFIYGSSIAYVNDIMKKHGNTITDSINKLSLTVTNKDPKAGSMLKLFEGISKIAPIAVATAFSVIPIRRTIRGITDTVSMMAEAVKSIQNIDLKSGIDTISSNIENFMNIPNKVSMPSDSEIANAVGNNWIGKAIGKVVGAGKMEMKLLYLMSISRKIAYITGTVGKSIYEIAKLQIPAEWDEKGNIVRYRQLRETDFDLAGQHVGTILTTMVKELNKVYTELEGSGFSFANSFVLGLIGEDPLSRIMNLSMKVSKVISSVGEAVGNIAQLQIPIEWNDQGKPISFRQLRKKDFTDAGTNITTVLTTMFTTLGKIASGEFLNDNNSGISKAEWDNLLAGDSNGLFGLGATKSKISQVIDLSFRISELIGNVGQGIKDIAKLQIPIDWDDKGHPTEYKTLNSNDFNDMGKSVGNILTAVISSLANLYYKPIDGEDGITVGSLFDGNDGVFGIGKKNSKIGTVVETSFKVSELIANVGKGIKDIAKLQVPNDWDDKGHPISYVDVTPEDFRASGEAIGSIITSILDSLVKYAGDERFTDGTMKTVLESIMPVNELVSGMADGIIKLANNQIPYKWDPKTGKPIEFREMKEDDYKNAAINVAAIAIGIGKALVDTFSKNPYKQFLFTADNQPTGNLKEVVDSVSGISKIVSNTTDAIVKIANALVPSHYDPKTGQPDKWEKLNMTEIQTALSTTIKQIVTSVSTTLIGVVEKNPHLFKEGKDSLFGQAVSSISGITKIVANIVDSVVKIGTAQIPKKINDQGQVIEYEKINIKTVIDNIKKTIPDMITSIGKSLISSYDTLQKQQIDQKLPGILHVNDSINKIIKKSANTLKEIAEMKIANGYDKDGNAKGYISFKEDQITQAKSKARHIISSLLTIFDEDTAKNEKAIAIDDVTLKNLINTSAQIQSAITEITTTIKSVINSFKPILENTDVISQLFKYKQQSKANIESTIGLFADIHDIFISFVKLQDLISGQSADQTIKQLYNENVRKQNEESNQIIVNSLQDVADTVQEIIDISAEIIDSYTGKIDLAKINYIKDNKKGTNIITDILEKFYDPILTLFRTWEADNSLLKNVLIDINTVNATLNTLLTGIKLSVNKNTIDSINNFKAAIDQIVVTMENSKKIEPTIISALQQNLTNLAKVFDIDIETSWGKTNLDIVSESLGKYIDTVIRFNPMALMNASTLRISIEQIYSSMSSQKSTNTFKANTDLLAKYVKTINSIDLRRTNALTQLVRELNELAKKMGNLDNLTDALANRLSYVLNELANRLEESKETINKADEIQIRRHSKITEAIKNVQTLIQQPLNIVVKSQAPDDTPNPDNGDEGGDTGGSTPGNPIKVVPPNNPNGQGGTTPDSAKQAQDANKYNIKNKANGQGKH